MSILTKFTGSLLTASLLLMVSGCDNNTKSKTILTSKAPTVAEKSLNNTKKTLQRALAKSDNDNNNNKISKLSTSVDMGTIIATFLNDNLEDSNSSDIVSSKTFLKSLTKDQNAIDAVDALTDADASTYLSLVYFDAIASNYDVTPGELATDSSSAAKQSKFQPYFLGGILDPITQPIKDLLNDTVTQPIKDGIVDIVDNNSVVSGIAEETFKVMLQSGTITKVMLKLAIKSNTISNVMIEVMDDHWNLAEQMQPLLENDVEFGNLFMDLALAHEGRNEGYTYRMAEFLFGRIDGGMYKSLTIAMTNSRVKNDDDTHTDGYITEVLSGLMAREDMTKFFKIPDSLAYTYAQVDTAFTKLLFDNNTTERGDGNEYSNERFFYEMFATAPSTANFITAMNNVADSNDTKIKGNEAILMDQIFMGKSKFGETDTNQGNYNIYAIAGGMAHGLGKGAANFSAYRDNFIGFALLIPTSRYIDYGFAFGGAGYSYYDNDLNAYNDDFKTLVEGTALDYNGTILDNVYVGYVSDLYTGSLGFIDGYYDTISGFVSDYDNNISAWYNNALAYYEGVKLDAQIAFESTFYGNTDTRINHFSNITENVATYKDGDFVGKALSNSDATWDYIPTKFAEKDWMSANTDVDATFNFKSGTVVAYVVATSPVAGFTKVELNGDEPLSSDDTQTYAIYKKDIASGDTLNIAVSANPAIKGVFFDSDNAIAN